MAHGSRLPLIPQWSPPTLADAGEYMGATPPIQQRHVMPMWCFPVEKRREIEAAVMADRPPEKWLHFVGCKMESRAWYEWHWHRGIDPDKKRPPISSYVRRKVIERDGLVCQLCFTDVEPSDIHLDHIIPFSKGGPDTTENLRVTHSRCNIRRGARD